MRNMITTILCAALIAATASSALATGHQGPGGGPHGVSGHPGSLGPPGQSAPPSPNSGAKGGPK